MATESDKSKKINDDIDALKGTYSAPEYVAILENIRSLNGAIMDYQKDSSKAEKKLQAEKAELAREKEALSEAKVAAEAKEKEAMEQARLAQEAKAAGAAEAEQKATEAANAAKAEANDLQEKIKSLEADVSEGQKQVAAAADSVKKAESSCKAFTEALSGVIEQMATNTKSVASPAPAASPVPAPSGDGSTGGGARRSRKRSAKRSAKKSAKRSRKRSAKKAVKRSRKRTRRYRR